MRMSDTQLLSRFETFYQAAYHDDLEATSALSDEQRFAVILAGFSALPLGTSALETEWTRLIQQGCAPELAEDTLVQMAAYIGFPRAQQCLSSLENAYAKNSGSLTRPVRSANERDNGSRYERGVAVYHRLNPDALSNIKSAFGQLAGDVVERTFLAFGDVYAQSEQTLITQQFATISALGTLGCAAPQLRFHIGAGLNVGITQEQIVETIAWIQFFAGAPAAYNALTELKAALAAGTGATPGYQ